MEKRSIETSIISGTRKAKEQPETKSRGPMFLSNAYGKVRSRYLGGPTGSCHDLCKYGHKHEFEDDRKHAVFRKFMSNGINSSSPGNPLTIGLKSPSLKTNRIKVSGQKILQDSSTDKVNLIEVLNSSKKKKKNQGIELKDPSLSETSSVKTTIFKDKVASYMKETITSSALKLNNQRKHTPSPRLHSKKKSVSDGFAKTSFRNNFDRNLTGPRNLDLKVSKSFKIVEVHQRNLPNLQKASLFFSKPVHNPANNSSFTIEDDGYTSESFVSDVTDCEIEEMKCKHNHKSLGEEEEEARRRTQVVQLDDDSPLPYKMKFKRGKVIELCPAETLDPKKLRFRKGRVIDDNSNGVAIRRIIRSKEIENTKAHVQSSEASVVVLKHQDSCEKKDVQALFNHVIEETASKLVKARKSKVKALVGAFETVILLQETKSAHVV